MYILYNDNKNEEIKIIKDKKELKEFYIEMLRADIIENMTELLVIDKHFDILCNMANGKEYSDNEIIGNLEYFGWHTFKKVEIKEF